jgi:hypothetical protein
VLIHEVEVTTDNAEWLRSNAPEPAATRLRHALDYDLVRVRFPDEEADQLLVALIDPPPGLEGLRTALLHEREHRSI